MMKKATLLLAAIVIFTFKPAKAQENHYAYKSKIGIGIETDFAENTLGYGFSLQFQCPLTTHLNLTATTSRISLNSTLKVMPKRDYKYIPLKLGARYFIISQIYLAGEIGVAIETTRDKKTSFLWSPGIGSEFMVSEKSALDIGLRYESFMADPNKSFLGLRLAFNYGL